MDNQVMLSLFYCSEGSLCRATLGPDELLFVRPSGNEEVLVVRLHLRLELALLASLKVSNIQL